MKKEKPYVKNAADTKQVKAAKEKEESRQERELNDVRHVLNSKEGRRFLWRYLGECGMFRTSFTGNSETFFKEGERNIGLKIMSDITAASDEAYFLMMKENGGQNV